MVSTKLRTLPLSSLVNCHVRFVIYVMHNSVQTYLNRGRKLHQMNDVIVMGDLNFKALACFNPYLFRPGNLHNSIWIYVLGDQMGMEKTCCQLEDLLH